jgi:polar amino acid transport system permease protein
MFSACADPSLLSGFEWFSCYLTTPKHLAFFNSFFLVLLLIAVVAPVALGLGFLAAVASRSSSMFLTVFGRGYIALARGVPDIVFFLFVPIALDQAFEYIRYLMLCPTQVGGVWQGNDFVVCSAAKLPLSSSEPIWHSIYGFGLAVISFGLVFGAFAGNVLAGAFRAVPLAQLQTGASFGMTDGQVFRRILVPQMWVYALPGLSNLWQILIKATPLLFLLGLQDIVYWARELGSSKTGFYAYPHPDWRLYYFGFLLVFYLALTGLSEAGYKHIMGRLNRGQATLAGGKKTTMRGGV